MAYDLNVHCATDIIVSYTQKGVKNPTPCMVRGCPSFDMKYAEKKVKEHFKKKGISITIKNLHPRLKNNTHFNDYIIIK